MLMPVDVEVDNDATLLLVVLRPVDSELTPLCAVLMPVDVDVDSDTTLLLVVLKPVDSDAIALDEDDTVVDSELTAVLVA
ncbi:hypothetical protein WJ98_24465 [Burkholderia ubonensis]|nr:hypothetical protein WJ98_24465 [Burkholderia ubonensis]